MFVEILRPRHIVVDRCMRQDPCGTPSPNGHGHFLATASDRLALPQGTNGEVPQILDASLLSSFTAVGCYISIDID